MIDSKNFFLEAMKIRIPADSPRGNWCIENEQVCDFDVLK